MKIKKLVLIAAAAFALGFGMTASAVQSNPFQAGAVGCFTCHNNCDVAFDNCLASGTAYATCSTRARQCHSRCGCPIP